MLKQGGWILQSSHHWVNHRWDLRRSGSVGSWCHTCVLPCSRIEPTLPLRFSQSRQPCQRPCSSGCGTRLSHSPHGVRNSRSAPQPHTSGVCAWQVWHASPWHRTPPRANRQEEGTPRLQTAVAPQSEADRSAGSARSAELTERFSTQTIHFMENLHTLTLETS